MGWFIILFAFFIVLGLPTIIAVAVRIIFIKLNRHLASVIATGISLVLNYPYLAINNFSFFSELLNKGIDVYAWYLILQVIVFDVLFKYGLAFMGIMIVDKVRKRCNGPEFPNDLSYKQETSQGKEP